MLVTSLQSWHRAGIPLTWKITESCGIGKVRDMYGKSHGISLKVRENIGHLIAAVKYRDITELL